MRKVKIGDFLFERKGRYKPNDEKIQGLKRIEKIDFSGNFHIGDKPSKTNMILVKQGDFVISGINVSKGAMGIYQLEEDVVATIHYSSYTFDEEKINVGYFKRFLKSVEFLNLISEQIKGGIKTEIKPKHILPLEINLPDIETQNKIVEKFESVETDIKKLNDEVAYQQTLLKQLRQSILQEAIEGKLTISWREKNPNIESATLLLEKIKAEKERLIKEKKIKKQKALAPIDKSEVPFDIPNGWVWCRTNDLCFNISSGSTPNKSSFIDNGIPYLKVYNIRNQKIDLEYKPQYIKEEINNTKLKRSILYPTDVVMNIVGPPLGKIAIIPNTYPKWNCNQAIVYFKLVEPLIHKYLYNFLKSLSFLKYIHFKGVAGQDNISITQSRSILIPLPPLEEQKQIVQKIETLFSICDKLEEQMNTSKKSAEMLMQSVLKEAFGE